MSLKPYRPSNGTEGEMFQAAWCNRCERDRVYRETQDGERGCKILSASYLYDPGDPEYPKEWVWDPEEMKRTEALGFGPTQARCTAFEPEAEGAKRAPVEPVACDACGRQLYAVAEADCDGVTLRLCGGCAGEFVAVSFYGAEAETTVDWPAARERAVARAKASS